MSNRVRGKSLMLRPLLVALAAALVVPSTGLFADDLGSLPVDLMTGRFYAIDGRWTYKFETAFRKNADGSGIDFIVKPGAKVSGGSVLGPTDEEGFAISVFPVVVAGMLDRAVASGKEVKYGLFGLSSRKLEDTDSGHFYTTRCRKRLFGGGTTIEVTETYKAAGGDEKTVVRIKVDRKGGMRIDGLTQNHGGKVLRNIEMIPEKAFKFSRIHEER